MKSGGLLFTNDRLDWDTYYDMGFLRKHRVRLITSIIVGGLWGILSAMYITITGFEYPRDTPLILRLPEIPFIIGARIYSLIAGAFSFILDPLLKYDSSGYIGLILFFFSPIVIFSILVYFLIDLLKLVYKLFKKIPL